MFRNYLLSAWRNVVKNRLFSAINILGLAIGLAASVLITLYVRHDISFDQQWSKLDRIYRVDMRFLGFADHASRFSKVSGQVQNAYVQSFPDDIEAAVRLRHLPALLRVGDTGFEDDVAWVDASLPDIFEFDVIKGDLGVTLGDLSSIALSESFAEKYFGTEDPMGKVLPVSAARLSRDYRVTAVYRDLSETSSVQIGALALIDEEAFREPSYILQNWGSTSVHQYLLLKPGRSIDTVRKGTPAMLDRFVPEGEKKGSERYEYRATPLGDFHLHWTSDDELSRMQELQILMTIALALIVIAAINFINLATARSMRRAREVALRKVLGARRRQLVVQFLTESCLTVLIAMFIAFAAVEVVLPFFADFLKAELALDLTDSFWMAATVSAVLGIGILAGLYPALVVSGWRPAFVLQANKSAETKGSVRLRQILVTAQFIASIVLIVVTLSVYGQSQYTIGMDPGFERKNILVVQGLGREEVGDKKLLLAERVRALPQVVDAALSLETPSDDNNNFGSYFFDAADGERRIDAAEMYIDTHFLNTYGLRLLAGRPFDDSRPADQLRGRDENGDYPVVHMLVNERTAREMGFAAPADAVGKTMRWYDNRTVQVIGVVQNAMTQSVRSEATNEIYMLQPGNGYALSARYSGAPGAIVQDVERLWRDIVPYVPFHYDFVEDMVADEFADEQRASTLLLIFSGVAVAVACLGLYGLATFMAESRTREIGIRKVMGARVSDIVRLFVWQLSKPVLVANAIAWPIAVYAMAAWLEQYPYRLDMVFVYGFCLLSGAAALLVAWLTVGGNAARVARTKPIQALRYE